MKRMMIYYLVHCIESQQLLTVKTPFFQDKNEENEKEKPEKLDKKQQLAKQRFFANKATLHEVEGFALVMLCSCKPIVRKLAGVVLKEIRNLFNLLNISKVNYDSCYKCIVICAGISLTFLVTAGCL